MLKVVIDTNLLIDGSEDFYNYGNRIIDLVISGQIEAYANKATLRENKFLADKKIADQGYLKKLEYFYDTVRQVKNAERLDVVEDSEDNKILESAVASEANYLITSDRHLLKLEKYQGVKIVRPAEFWSRYEDEGEGWTKWIKNFIK
ncbi:MAG: putative toxin-antitoxin system toxin component, PIN family [Candidatus Doudnabacteria bacterium]|nr:putative toxin-antitoxin system toxin component, PIN family [Candidatus Doudnabacteria bacterium]